MRQGLTERAPGRRHLNQILGEAALRVAGGSRVWDVAAWRMGAASEGAMAMSVFPLLLAEVMEGNLKTSRVQAQPLGMKAECVYGHFSYLYFNHLGLKIRTL